MANGDHKANMADALHKEYLDKLEVPSVETIERIAQVQEQKEMEVQEKYHNEEAGRAGTASSPEEQQRQAAGKIQRTYRGHRSRRQLQGLSLDPSTRWVDAITEARYRSLNTPRRRRASESTVPEELNSLSTRSSSDARRLWQHAGGIARHAVHSDDSSSTSSSQSRDLPTPIDQAFRAHCKRQEKKEKEIWKGKMMDISYFLEMIDLKHRYGSNLRAYHTEWKKAKTTENFFFWLDHGEGRHVELSICTRERLEKEQVRYLSREERMNYLVDIDDAGKLRWHKNGQLIDTTEAYRDSVEGIVPQGDKAKPFHPADLLALQEGEIARDGDVGADCSSPSSDDSGSLDENGATKNTKGTKKVIQVSPAVIFTRLLRKATGEKKNSWLFVVDTSMNLYVGIKRTGSFQHSSFLHGSRISAAGLIKIHNGQLRSLSPLSGHYRPPTSAFKHFISHLKAENADMSRMSISKSYAVLVGLEAYVGGKGRAKKIGSDMKKGIARITHPHTSDAAREREGP